MEYLNLHPIDICQMSIKCSGGQMRDKEAAVQCTFQWFDVIYCKPAGSRIWIKKKNSAPFTLREQLTFIFW